jgi:hypothetical protein
MSQQPPPTQREIWRRGIADALSCAAGSIIPTLLASIAALFAARAAGLVDQAPVDQLGEFVEVERPADVDQVDVDQVAP